MHISQSEIHELMIAFAREGLMVVRLKVGDPLLFGRAGEEIEALHDAEVECEVVPGATAALAVAAAAHIPLTDHRLGGNVIFLSNHHSLEKNETHSPRAIPADTTVVVYMPGKNYTELSQRLTSAGMDPVAPCLIVSCASRPEQLVHRSTLRKPGRGEILPAPAVVIVGDVTRLHRADEDQEMSTRAAYAVTTVAPT